MKNAAFHTIAKFALTTVLLATPAAIFAQPAGQNDRQTIDQRKHDRQARIRQGDRTGQLTRGESARLEHRERGIDREERGMRARDNGHLTHVDRRVLRYRQNVESHRIYRDKHNARVR